jgi:hypothetical protein
MVTKTHSLIGRRVKITQRRSGRFNEIGVILKNNEDDYIIEFPDSLDTLKIKREGFILLQQRGIHKNY